MHPLCEAGITHTSPIAIQSIIYVTSDLDQITHYKAYYYEICNYIAVISLASCSKFVVQITMHVHSYLQCLIIHIHDM